MNKSGIYIIKNYITGKVYVGSAINLNKRWSAHKMNLLKGKHHSKRLQNSWNKYGADNFEFIIIQYCTKETLISNEQFWIDYFDSYNNGYNSVPIAGRPKGYKHTDEAKKKISEASKKLIRTTEWKEKIKQSTLGRIVSKETREKMSKSRIGKQNSLGNKLSNETKNKISSSLKEFNKLKKEKNG